MPNGSGQLDVVKDLLGRVDLVEREDAGIEPGAAYRAVGAAGGAPLVALAATGGEGRRDWYLDGTYLFSATPGQVIPQPLAGPGAHQIVVVDESGNIDKVEVRVVR